MLRRNSEESKDVVETIVEDDLPSELCCPITYQPFKQPILGSDGRFYEYDSIKTHLQHDYRSPFTREILILEELPQPIVKKIENVIEECKEKSKEWQKKLKTRDDTIARLNEKISKLEKQPAHASSDALQMQIELLCGINSQLQETVKNLKNTLAIKHSPPLLDVSLPPGALQQSFVNSRFLRAVKKLSIRETEYYLREGADINAVDYETNETAMMIVNKNQYNNPSAAKQLMSILKRHKEMASARERHGFFTNRLSNPQSTNLYESHDSAVKMDIS